MKVKILSSATYYGLAAFAGDIVDVSEELANKMIKNKAAVLPTDETAPVVEPVAPKKK